jgi:lipoate-protein ligase A
MPYRVIPLRTISAAMITAFSELAIRTVGSGSDPIIAAYKCFPAAVVVASQQMAEEVDFDFVDVEGYDFTRMHFDGRGYVLDDSVLVLTKVDHAKISDDKQPYDSLSKDLRKGLVQSLHGLGVDVQIAHRFYNDGKKETADGYDLQINGKTVCGIGKCWKNNALLQQVSLRISEPNLAHLATAFLDYGKEDVSVLDKRITWLSRENVGASVLDIYEKIVRNLAKGEFFISEWDDNEFSAAQKLYEKEFSRAEWLHSGKERRGLCELPRPGNLRYEIVENLF